MKTQLANKKFLIIDDEIFTSNWELFSRITNSLLFQNIEILVAETLVESKEIVNSNDIDLILLDLLFPSGDISLISDERYNGLLFLRYLRANEKFQKIPVICMSAAGGEKITSEIKELDSFLLRKPMQTVEMYNIILKYILD